MNENSFGSWGLLSGSSPMNADASIASPGNTYGGSVAPSALNGYPMFSSSQANDMAPSGYANANPVDSTPSAIMPQARSGTATPMPINPHQPEPAQMNPWNIKTSSPSGPFDYPLGQNSAPPKLNVL